MKLVVTTLITLGAAVGFALIAMEDPGYVVLARAPYTVRLPLALFVLVTLAVFAGLYLFFNLLAGVLRAPERLRRWRQKRNQARAQTHTMQGYAGLIEGDWSRAEKKLLINLRDHQSPLLNYLGAAYSAQQQGYLRRRDGYLDDALAHHPGQRLAISLTRARLHYQAGEIAECRDVLEKLRQVAPKNVPAARLLADAYRDLRDWNSLAALMPALARLKAFPPDELAAREQGAYVHFLSSPALLQGEGDRPTQAFKALPLAKRKDPGIIASYCRQLMAAGNPALAEKTLRKALNRRFDAQLAALYGQVETAFVDDQIKLAESWAKKYGATSHPDLTLALGRLYRRGRQWEKAKELLAAVVADGSREEARADLGSLLEEMGDAEGALRCYRGGVEAFAVGVDADAPRLSAGELVGAEGEGVESQGSAGVMPVVR